MAAFPIEDVGWGWGVGGGGENYTIRWMRIFPAKRGQKKAVVLEELQNPDNRLHFHIERFLPAVSFEEPSHEIVVGYVKEAATVARFDDFPPLSQIATF